MSSKNLDDRRSGNRKRKPLAKIDGNLQPVTKSGKTDVQEKEDLTTESAKAPKREHEEGDFDQIESKLNFG